MGTTPRVMTGILVLGLLVASAHPGIAQGVGEIRAAGIATGQPGLERAAGVVSIDGDLAVAGGVAGCERGAGGGNATPGKSWQRGGERDGEQCCQPPAGGLWEFHVWG